MKKFRIIFCVISLSFGCTATDRPDSLMGASGSKAFSTPDLVPFIQNTLSKACDDLKSLIIYFHQQLLVEQKDIFNSVPAMINIIDKVVAPELSDYSVRGHARNYNIYVALGHDLQLMYLLKGVLAELNLRPILNGPSVLLFGRDVKVAAMLLFNLEQVAYYISSLTDVLTEDNLRKIKINRATTVEDVSHITSCLFLFMQARDELIKDFRHIIGGAAMVKGERRLMESELKKIVNDGEIKRKISYIGDLAKDIQDMVIQLTKVTR
ncbi:hypothetical protein bcCo53_001154 (plasmid) [Borrelia coriaceae]|nr:hypothetical protein [Borrelia coriaceae]UPA16986.1 hypothetical protein bcCo53_001154 [Borrelia coriaceae]